MVRSGGRPPRRRASAPRARPPFRAPRAPLSAGAWLARGLRGERRLRARVGLLPAPRRCRAWGQVAASHSPHWGGPEGEGVKSAPSRRPHLLGAGPAGWVAWPGLVGGWGRGAGSACPARPAWGGGRRPVLQRTALLPAGRGGAALLRRPASVLQGLRRPHLPDRGRAWAGRVLSPLRRRKSSGLGPGADCGLCPAWGFLSGVTPHLPSRVRSRPPSRNALSSGNRPCSERCGSTCTAQIPVLVPSRYPALLSRGRTRSGVFVIFSPPSNFNNKRARVGQPLDFILRLSTSLPFPSARWNRPLLSWLLYGMCHLWRGCGLYPIWCGLSGALLLINVIFNIMSLRLSM